MNTQNQKLIDFTFHFGFRSGHGLQLHGPVCRTRHDSSEERFGSRRCIRRCV